MNNLGLTRVGPTLTPNLIKATLTYEGVGSALAMEPVVVRPAMHAIVKSIGPDKVVSAIAFNVIATGGAEDSPTLIRVIDKRAGRHSMERMSRRRHPDQDDQ